MLNLLKNILGEIVILVEAVTEYFHTFLTNSSFILKTVILNNLNKLITSKGTKYIMQTRHNFQNKRIVSEDSHMIHAASSDT